MKIITLFYFGITFKSFGNENEQVFINDWIACELLRNFQNTETTLEDFIVIGGKIISIYPFSRTHFLLLQTYLGLSATCLKIILNCIHLSICIQCKKHSRTIIYFFDKKWLFKKSHCGVKIDITNMLQNSIRMKIPWHDDENYENETLH